MPIQYDVAVVGGGPAGLATAIEATLLGFHTVILDGRHPPIDKACGEGLMPDALTRLARFGISIAPGERGPFRGIEFSDESSRVAAEFPWSGHAAGVKRTTLQRLLAKRAEETGVEFLWNTPVTGLDAHDVICRNCKVQARWIVGADGMHSHVKRWVGLDRYLWSSERVAFRQRFDIRPFSEYVQVIWGEAGQCYITPVGPSEISVAVITRRRDLGFRELLRSFPSLSDRLPASAATSAVLGSLTASRRLRRVSIGHVALVGDASGSVDAITGEGICLALQQAKALGSAMKTGDLRTYVRKHAGIMRHATLMAAALGAMGRNHGLRRRAIRTLSQDPQLFERMLAFHLGATGLRNLGLFASLRLGSSLLRPLT